VTPHPMNGSGIRLLSWIALTLAACDPGTSSRSPGTIHTDSAGIAIATAVEPQWGPGEDWTVSPEPDVQIGAATGASEYLLEGVVGVARLSNGDILLGEWSTGELGRYDPEGGLVWRASGRGEGPGEHAFMMFMDAVAGDSAVTYDDGLNRVQVFAPDGGIARTLAVESPWSGFGPRGVVGMSGRRMIMTFADARGEIPAGVVRWPGIRVATFSLDDGSIEALTDAPGGEQMIENRESGGILYKAYTFAKGPEFSVHDGRLALVDTEVFSIRFLSLDDGSVSAMLKRDEPVREVTGEHVDAYVEWMVARNMYGGRTRKDVEPYIPMWRGDPMAETLPVLLSIHLDAVGNLWVEPFSPHGAETPPMEVYTPEGDWLGNVAMPPDLHLGSRGIRSGFEIGDDYIIGVWIDDLDVQYVRQYALMK